MKDPGNLEDQKLGGIGESTSWSLLERVKAGEPDGWRRLLYLYSPLVRSRCRRAGLSESEAEEIVQEVSKTLVMRIGSFQKQPGPSFRGWLKAITRNKLGDHFRRTRNATPATGGTDAQASLNELADGYGEDDVGEVSERQLLCRRALLLVSSEFQPRSWEAAWRVVVEERSATEVAADLGMTANAVYVAKSRVLSRLREVLTELGESGFEADPRAIEESGAGHEAESMAEGQA